MIFAQIKDQIIKNTVVLNDTNLLSLFTKDPITGEPYDSVIQIDTIYPQPGIGWWFDNVSWNAPIVPDEVVPDEGGI